MKEQRREISKAIKAKDIVEAKRKCKEYLEIEEDDARVLLYLGYCYTELHEYGLAHSSYQKAKACTGAEEVAKEIALGLGKVFFQENQYFERPEASKKEEEHVILSCIGIYTEQKKALQKEAYILYLLEMYRYTDTEKYISAAETYLNLEENTPDKLTLPERDTVDILVGYVVQQLKGFRTGLKNLVEQGTFSKMQKEVQHSIDALLISKQTKTEKYCNQLLAQSTAAREYLLDKAWDLYIFYLCIKVYVRWESLNELSAFLELGRQNRRPLEQSALALKLLLSDYLDFPGVFGTLEEYKPCMYNTLSPTIISLRFPERKSQCYSMYESLEKETGFSYRLKKECITAEMYKETLLQNLSKNIGYTGEDVLQEIKDKHTPISCASALIKFLEPALKHAHFSFIGHIFQERENSSMHSSNASLLTSLKHLEIRGTRLEEHSPSFLDTTKELWSIAVCADKGAGACEGKDEGVGVDITEYIYACKIDEIHVQLIHIHTAITQDRIEYAHSLLPETCTALDALRMHVRDTEDQRVHARAAERIDKLYAYGKFLVLYVNKAVACGPSPAEDLCLEESPSSIAEHTYTSEYSARTFQRRSAPHLPPLSLLPHPVHSQCLYQQHMLGVHYYETGRPAQALSLLRGLYQENPDNYFLVSDLALYLNAAQSKLEAIGILDKYLRGRVIVHDTHLFSLSLELLREFKHWQRAEMRCKELLSLGYTYKVSMALAESLAHQKKPGYSLKVVQDVISRETDLHRVASGKVFTVYLQIKTEEFEEAVQSIDALLADKSTPKTFFSMLSKYWKYAYASQLRTAITKDGMKKTLECIAQFGTPAPLSPLPSTEAFSSLDYTVSVAQCYVSVLAHVFQHAPLSSTLSVPEVPEQAMPDTERQRLLVTTAKLHLLVSCARGNIKNPQVHKRVSAYLKQASIYGETNEALETELVLRLIREENLKEFYKGDRVSEETPSARVIQALLYTPSSLPASIREYAKFATLADASFLMVLARAIAEHPLQSTKEDLETVFLHLSRRYSPDSSEIGWMYAQVQN
ncbi:hypothetical protein NECID01_0214 [Nematocida sp. AWRm77]|nr:hypothetical protein NECID01_0214 [Nematocida sp. AWRm77]